MSYRYYICDVFTTEKFGGNQLAVVPEAEGLSDDQMQRIAREFNFSETTFLFPSENDCTRRVRIFTPSVEVPFAGHPNIGTAYVLAVSGELEAFDESIRIEFEEGAGRVPICIEKRDDGRLYCELCAPEKLSLGRTVAPELVASALSLPPDDLLLENHLPTMASVGLPFIMTEVRERSALERIRVNLTGFEAIADLGIMPDIHIYVRTGDQEDDLDIRARMFAPFDGVMEDPATGSANTALAAMLAHHDAKKDSGDYAWTIGQGFEMGRPSVMRARARKSEGTVVGAWIGGYSVLFSEGTLYEDS